MFEMVIIAGVALVVVGPEKFPPFAKAVFKTFRDLKSQIEETQREITKEIKPLQKEMRELSKYKPEDYIDKLTAGTKTDGDPDFDYEYPYNEHDTTTKDKSESETKTDTDTDGGEPPEGTETFDAAGSPPVDSDDKDVDAESDGPDLAAASGDGTD